MINIVDLEEKEIKFREQNARKNALQVLILEEEYFPYTNFEVIGTSQIRYFVEIRSLTEKINSCSCPDFHVNTLGMCKHIEGIMHFIKQELKENIEKFAQQGSPRIEIFLNPKQEEISLTFPSEHVLDPSLEKLFSSFFTPNGLFIEDPIYNFFLFENQLDETLEDQISKVRISNHLKQWISEKQLRYQREIDQKQFLEDVKNGRRSLQILSSKLFPYQEEGVQHLALKGKAILADEMGLGKTIQAIGACELLRRLDRVKKVLVVSPASLKGEVGRADC